MLGIGDGSGNHELWLHLMRAQMCHAYIRCHLLRITRSNALFVRDCRLRQRRWTQRPIAPGSRTEASGHQRCCSGLAAAAAAISSSAGGIAQVTAQGGACRW